MIEIISRLNSGGRHDRLAAAAEIAAAGNPPAEKPGDEVNNHIHTSFSFSPYSPAAAAYMAWNSGLKAAGSVDHDSISAAAEMTEACRLFGIGSTSGYEIRVDFSGCLPGDRKINNPDTPNNAYIVIHGVPHNRRKEADEWLAPVRAERNRRNRRQIERLNGLISGMGIGSLSWEGVKALSESDNGGSVTERHILYALASRIAESFGRGRGAADFVRKSLGLELPERIGALLEDGDNPHYLYDLLGVLKSSLVPKFFIQPSKVECPPASEAVRFANSIGAIPAYSYLGDVAESPTGDKKAEHFEDGYLDELFEAVSAAGFKAVTYMPPRNTAAQLERVRLLCARYGFMQISGVDINSSRQSFHCPEILRPEFSHLTGSTWALIAHEHLASADPDLAFFAETGPLSGMGLDSRLAVYAEAGMEMDLRNPESVYDIMKRKVSE